MVNYQYTKEDLIRFGNKVNIPYTKEGNLDYNLCWEWTGSIRDKNSYYGSFGLGNSIVSAHRFSYFVTFGSFSSNLCVCHHCDNPLCVNPYHLWLGTKSENNKDRSNKGRTISLYGKENGYCNVSTECLNQLLEDLYYQKYKTLDDAIRKYNINREHITSILRGNKIRGKLNFNDNQIKFIHDNYIKKLTDAEVYDEIIEKILNGSYVSIKRICQDYNLKRSTLSAVLTSSYKKLNLKHTASDVKKANELLEFDKRKLTRQEAKQIKYQYPRYSHRDVGRLFGVSRSVVKKIRNNVSYVEI